MAGISLSPAEHSDVSTMINQAESSESFSRFGQLQAIDLNSVEPTLRADTEGDNLRQDVPQLFNNRDAMIAAVPTYEDSYIKVPKIILNKE